MGTKINGVISEGAKALTVDDALGNKRTKQDISAMPKMLKRRRIVLCQYESEIKKTLEYIDGYYELIEDYDTFIKRAVSVMRECGFVGIHLEWIKEETYEDDSFKPIITKKAVIDCGNPENLHIGRNQMHFFDVMYKYKQNYHRFHYK